jgi:hypothetical protein
MATREKKQKNEKEHQSALGACVKLFAIDRPGVDYILLFVCITFFGVCAEYQLAPNPITMIFCRSRRACAFI